MQLQDAPFLAAILCLVLHTVVALAAFDLNHIVVGGLTASATNFIPKLSFPPKGKPPLSSDAQEYLAAHNALRQKLHLQPLQWDEKLANYAQGWALERINDCDQHHHSNGPYGENILWELYDEKDPREVVQVWIDEQNNYDLQKFTCKCSQEDSDCMCGHYTQLVWYSTQRVGCANMTCNEDLGIYIVCSYDPPGNYPNKNPFGKPINGQSSSSPSSSSSVHPPPPTTRSTPSRKPSPSIPSPEAGFLSKAVASRPSPAHLRNATPAAPTTRRSRSASKKPRRPQPSPRREPRGTRFISGPRVHP